MARSDFRCIHPMRVRWSEVDKQGVVFNANYLTYCDVGMGEYWRGAGQTHPGGLVQYAHDLYMVKTTVEYRASALYDDMLNICMRCSRIGRSSLQMTGEIWRGEEMITSAELIYVYVDPATTRSAPVPDNLRGAIRRFEVITPAT
jgi:acyl-CoA thioester hydrolase